MALPDTATDLAEEIRSLVLGDDLSRATKRLLDYAKQVSRQQDVINAAIVLTRELRSLQRTLRDIGDLPDRDSKFSALAKRILEVVDEIEAVAEERLLVESPETPRLWVVPKAPPPQEDIQADESTRGEGGNSGQSLTNFEQAQKEFVEKRKGTVPASAVALEACSLQKSYKGGFVLSAIDLTLRPGEITGLIGINGSGKTTLLRILAGELSCDGGGLSYPLLCSKGLDWVRIRSQIAFVPQRPPRWHGILEENLYLHAALRQITGKANHGEVEFILHRLGLESYRKARWSEISGGFQMRFELAKALVGKPKLLILDEPLAPLDINTQQVFLQDLRDFANSSREPLPIILSSQHIYEVEAIADWILFLDGGKVVFSGSLAKLYEERKENAFEVISPSGKVELLEVLDPLGVIDIEHTGLTYIISMPSSITARKILDQFFKRDVQVKYFRDISGSSRKLFRGRGEQI